MIKTFVKLSKQVIEERCLQYLYMYACTYIIYKHPRLIMYACV